MIRSTDIGLFKSIYLLWLTAKQEKAILDDKNNGEYLELCCKHFKAYFGKDLRTTLLDEPNSPEAKAFLHRHGCMVVSICIPKASKILKKCVYRVAAEAFIKNLLLEEELI